MILPIITALSGIFTSVAARVSPDRDEQQRIVGELRGAMLENAAMIERAAADVVLAEAQGESWLQRNWRPLTMLTFVSIVANNYIIYPYVTAFGGTAVYLEIPPDMWALLKIGIGGYVVGRSGEKIAKVWKEKAP